MMLSYMLVAPGGQVGMEGGRYLVMNATDEAVYAIIIGAPEAPTPKPDRLADFTDSALVFELERRLDGGSRAGDG